MNGHKIINQNGLHFLTPTVVGWIDVFTRKKYKDTIVESLEYCMQHKGMQLFAFVIMSNHIHLIVKAKEGYFLSDIIRDFKTYTSKAIFREIKANPEESRSEWMLRLFKNHARFNSKNKEYQFWKKDNKPIKLTSPDWINKRIMYIHNNPVNSGTVNKPENYIYSSASNYVHGKGVLDVSCIDLGFDIGFVNG